VLLAAALKIAPTDGGGVFWGCRLAGGLLLLEVDWKREGFLKTIELKANWCLASGDTILV
jgi:hypothetical protein